MSIVDVHQKPFNLQGIVHPLFFELNAIIIALGLACQPKVASQSHTVRNNGVVAREPLGPA
jgi:hypothetical protein